MKGRSIAKLELQAALLGTRLKEGILEALTIHVSNTSMRTDSTTVLRWLNSDSKQPTFLANRVREIPRYDRRPVVSRLEWGQP